ncbi:kynureninase [Gloeophyllum trabeum ATCC 11539]|uniref:Kynureninase n=1 Tax=Gloeophyllum trabeum (strain ATCC 11539 / FP-39264 / Madison 617) TaxID=670483 RepID=S7QFK3_GLOTA|nr:kynureninase [Gloeophyllum trabeum ATCC 11539]EPQ58202.1 kynureninase [Gloeophyllum trabeum ATCC 11539]
MLRHLFVLPSNNAVGALRVPPEQGDNASTYLCGNSLGALPKRSAELVSEELSVWGSRAVEGHFSHPHGREWMNIADRVTPYLARLLGAHESEVACMGTLTANLHLMMNVFYKPSSTRYKILCEGRAFPSDQYAFASQALLHGFEPQDAIIELSPRPGEFVLREEDILQCIREQGTSIALVLFSGVQYYTGQWFPMQSITRAAKEQGCICGFDLAHAVGNVPLSLHDWGVDFAVWCSYKYLNSGPGGIAGLYMHDRWDDIVLPKLAGWWGHDPATRFQMPPTFSPIRGAQGFQQSNPSVLATVSLLGSLQVFEEAGLMGPIRAKSLELTGLLESKLRQSKWYVPTENVAELYPDANTRLLPEGERVPTVGKPGFTIITPSEPESRGAQLSLLFLPTGAGIMQKVFDELKSYGVVGDERKPDVIRLAPAPLYNTADDCERAAAVMETVFNSLYA